MMMVMMMVMMMSNWGNLEQTKLTRGEGDGINRGQRRSSKVRWCDLNGCLPTDCFNNPFKEGWLGLLFNDGAWVVKKEEEETKEEEEEEVDGGLGGTVVEQFSHKVRTVKPGGGPCSLGISHMGSWSTWSSLSSLSCNSWSKIFLEPEKVFWLCAFNSFQSLVRIRDISYPSFLSPHLTLT